MTDEEKVLSATELYDKFSRHEKLTSDEAEAILPDRQLQIDVFKAIKAKPLKDKECEVLCVRLGDDGGKLAKINAVIDIMIEMGILAQSLDNLIYVPETTSKVNLEDSEIMKRLRTFL